MAHPELIWIAGGTMVAVGLCFTFLRGELVGSVEAGSVRYVVKRSASKVCLQTRVFGGADIKWLRPTEARRLADAIERAADAGDTAPCKDQKLYGFDITRITEGGSTSCGIRCRLIDTYVRGQVSGSQAHELSCLLREAATS